MNSRGRRLAHDVTGWSFVVSDKNVFDFLPNKTARVEGIFGRRLIADVKHHIAVTVAPDFVVGDFN